MVRSLIRTLRGPSRDPLMGWISRPLPRDLPDEQVIAALAMALEENPDPAYLVETLPAALRRVTGRSLQVLDRTARDVTGTYGRISVMIRDGDVGHWRGYDANPYALTPESGGDAGRALHGEPSPRMPGWEPPGPLARDRQD